MASNEAHTKDDTKSVVTEIEQAGGEVILEEHSAEILKRTGIPLKRLDADVLAIVGSDRHLLSTLLKIGESSLPVLPISSTGQPTFFSEITVKGFETIVEDLISEQWVIEKRLRLVGNIGGRKTPPFINDLGLFCKRSATLLRYSLYLDGEMFWKDGSDGVLIATPTGSTGYSMSVGGPVILHPAHVMMFVSVNSTNPARRPLIVSDSMEIQVRDLDSSITIEAIVDGQRRMKVKDDPVLVKRADSDATFVKFDEEKLAALRGKLHKKSLSLDNAHHEIPPSAKLVLKVLEYQDQLTQKQIILETMLPSRTVRYALSILISEGIVKKQVSLRDSRQALYSVVKQKKSTEELKEK